MNLENYKLNTSQVHNNGGTLYKYKNVLYKSVFLSFFTGKAFLYRLTSSSSLGDINVKN